MNNKIMLLLAFALFFFIFCFYALEIQDMENVELLTSESIRRSWMKLLSNRLRMGHPPLYFLLSKLLMISLDHNLVSLYIFPIVIGATGIPLIYFLGREQGLGKGALLASFFWSIHPAVLYYSRYIRPQIGIVVLCTLYLLVLLRNLEQPKITNKFLLLSLGMVGALWSHLFLFFWLSILFASLLIRKVRKCASKEYWLTIVLALFSQVAVTGIVRAFSGSIKERLEWVKLPTFYDVYKILIQALGAVTGNIHVAGLLWLTPFLGLLSFFIVLYLNNVKKQNVFQTRTIQTEDRWNLLLISALLSSVILLALTFTLQPLWVQRYLVILLPVVILSMAQAFFFIRWRSLALAFGAFIVFSCSINSVKMIYQRNFGLRDRISELEKQYDDNRDVVQVLNIATREALRIYSTKELNHFVIRRSSNHDLAFQLIEENTKGKERLWVLEFPRKDSVLKTKKWKSFEKKQFYNLRNNKLALFGYTLPVMLSEKQVDL